jgi:hypothetical protein
VNLCLLVRRLSLIGPDLFQLRFSVSVSARSDLETLAFDLALLLFDWSLLVLGNGGFE